MARTELLVQLKEALAENSKKVRNIIKPDMDNSDFWREKYY
ncbi:hypothetical protein [Pectinatus frisingensis]|nr:hypothetical protein [Pectinatus frisingensis]